MADEVRDAPGAPAQGPGRQGRSAADKERTKAQSRPVSAKQAGRAQGSAGRPQAKGGPAKKAGTNGRRAQGRVRPAPGRRPPPSAAGRRSTTTLLTWGTVGVVIVIVVVLVAVKVFGGSSSTGNSSNPLPASIAHDLATIPTSAYDQVGTNSPSAPITKPTVVHGQPPLTFTVDGKTLPGVFYYGAEYCPYCAAERWAVAASLKRFGTFSGLRETSSSSKDVFASTPTLSFYKSTLTSPYIAFQHVEAYSNNTTASGNYAVLQKPTAAQLHLVEKYDTGTYVQALRSSNANGSIPFIDIGNRLLVSGASYSPAILAGLSRAQIASDLHDPKNPVTQAILATSNYLSAGICSSDGQRPTSVCTSKGVVAAAKGLGLTS